MAAERLHPGRELSEASYGQVIRVMGGDEVKLVVVFSLVSKPFLLPSAAAKPLWVDCGLATDRVRRYGRLCLSSLDRKLDHSREKFGAVEAREQSDYQPLSGR